MKPRQSLQLRSIFLLRCPHCATSSLLKPGSWFEFQEGCELCSYRYERESGYFLGAPWMISYPLVGMVCLLLSISLFSWITPRFGMLGLSGLVALAAIISGLFFYPYARAIWMFGDHLFNPLEDRECTYRLAAPAYPRSHEPE